MKAIKAPLLACLFVLFLSPMVAAQEPAPEPVQILEPDENVQQLVMDFPGFTRSERFLIPIADYNVLIHAWEGTNGERFEVVYALPSDPLIAREIFAELAAVDQRNVDTGNNDAVGLSGGQLTVLRGNAVMGMVLRGGANPTGSLDSFLEAANSKLDSLGLSPQIGHIAPQLTISSDEVTSSSSVEFTVDVINPDLLDGVVFAEIVSPENPNFVVMSRQSTISELPLIVDWNGQDSGLEAPNGVYRLEVTAQDTLGRRKIVTHQVIVDLGAPGPTSLGSIADSTLVDKRPHTNEGANPALIIKKVQGKPTRALAGFGLANQNLNGLVSATLVFNIDPGFSPTGWGNGRNISAIPVSANWVEGNGKDLEVPNNQQTSGSGAGVTWFSPIDEDISNNSSNSAVNWDGASFATGPRTAPPVSIRNHQTGEVQFDVTQDVLNGTSSWLITRDEENVGSKVHFLSKEGGGASLGPRLILDYGGGSAAAGDKNRALAAVHAARLKKNVPDFESSIQYVLNPDLVMAASQEFLAFAFRGHPFAEVFTRLFFGGWQAGLV